MVKKAAIDSASSDELAASDYALVHRTSSAPDPAVHDVSDPGTPRPPQKPLQPRAQVVVDAQSGRMLDSHMAQGLVHAAHREHQEHFARQRDTSPGAYLRHLFGLNRDRDHGDRA